MTNSTLFTLLAIVAVAMPTLIGLTLYVLYYTIGNEDQ